MRTKTLANLLLQSVLLQPLQADLVIRQANNTAPQCNLSQTVSSKVCQKTNDLIKKYEIKRSNQEGAPYNASSAEIAKIFQKLELDKMEISDFLTASSTDLAKRLTFLTKTTKRVEPPKKTQEANLFKPFNPHEITTALKSKNFSYTEYENCINYKPISTGPDLVAEVIQEESFTWSTLEHKNTRKYFLIQWLKANGTQYCAFNEAPLITFLNYSRTTTNLLQKVLNLLTTLLKSDLSLENQQKFASSISQITPHLSSLEALDLENLQEKCEEFLNYTTSNKYISLAFDTINNLSDKNIQKH